MMTPERELWACALLIEKQYGEGAAAHIAERIQSLAASGDVAGAARWSAIADRHNQLQGIDSEGEGGTAQRT